MAFRVGQKVVCVNNKSIPGSIWRGIIPRENEVYTVTGITIVNHPLCGETVCLQLGEILNEEIWNGAYGAFRFRPVVSTDTGMAILEQIRRDVSNKILRPIFEDEQV